VKKKLPLNISDIAFDKIIEIKSSKQIPDDYSLRLGVKSAGCGIASYIIGFDHMTEKDEIFEWKGIEIIIEKIQLMYLAGKSVEYKISDEETGFVFIDGN